MRMRLVTLVEHILMGVGLVGEVWLAGEVLRAESAAVSDVLALLVVAELVEELAIPAKRLGRVSSALRIDFKSWPAVCKRRNLGGLAGLAMWEPRAVVSGEAVCWMLR